MQINLPANLELITVTDHTIPCAESHGIWQTGESVKKLEAAFKGAVHIIHKNKGKLNMYYDNYLLD